MYSPQLLTYNVYITTPNGLRTRLAYTLARMNPKPELSIT